MQNSDAIRNWRVYANQPGSVTYMITGTTLVEAIESHFKRIASDNRIGNVAGYHLNRVRLEPPDPNVTRGSVPYARLLIWADGQPLAHSGSTYPNNKLTEVNIVIGTDEIIDAHEFEIRPQNKA